MRQFFLIVTGESWPEADEDQLRALARLYAELVRILAAVEEELAVIEAAIAGGGWQGDAAQAVLARLKELRNGGGLRKLAEAAEKMSRFAFDAGANVEYAKASILGQLAILTAQILMLLPWVSFPPTSAQASGWISQLIAFGRYMSQTFFRRLVMSVAVGIGLQVGLDVMIQVTQLLAGTRHRWDGRRTAGAVLSGVIGGVVGGVLVEGAVRVVGRAVARAADPERARAWAMWPVLVVTGAGTEFTAEQLADLILNGRIQQSDDPWAAASAGAVEGVVDGAEHVLSWRGRRDTVSVGLDGHVGPINIAAWVPIGDGTDQGGGGARFSGPGVLRGDFGFDGAFGSGGAFEGLVTFTGVWTRRDGTAAAGSFTGSGRLAATFTGGYTRTDLRADEHGMIAGHVRASGVLTGQFDVTGTFTPLPAGATIAAPATPTPSTPAAHAVTSTARAGGPTGAGPTASTSRDGGPADNTAVIRPDHADAVLLPADADTAVSGTRPTTPRQDPGGATHTVSTSGEQTSTAPTPPGADRDTTAPTPSGAGRDTVTPATAPPSGSDPADTQTGRQLSPPPDDGRNDPPAGDTVEPGPVGRLPAAEPDLPAVTEPAAHDRNPATSGNDGPVSAGRSPTTPGRIAPRLGIAPAGTGHGPAAQLMAQLTALPLWDETGDCVPRVWQVLHGLGVKSPATRDDGTGSRSVDDLAHLLGGAWQHTTAQTLRQLAPGELTVAHLDTVDRPRHVLLVWRDTDGQLWQIETQARPAASMTPIDLTTPPGIFTRGGATGPAVLSQPLRLITDDNGTLRRAGHPAKAAGKLIPTHLPADDRPRTDSHATIRALLDPPTSLNPGMAPTRHPRTHHTAPPPGGNRPHTAGTSSTHPPAGAHPTARPVPPDPTDTATAGPATHHHTRDTDVRDHASATNPSSPDDVMSDGEASRDSPPLDTGPQPPTTPPWTTQWADGFDLDGYSRLAPRQQLGPLPQGVLDWTTPDQEGSLRELFRQLGRALRHGRPHAAQARWLVTAPGSRNVRADLAPALVQWLQEWTQAQPDTVSTDLLVKLADGMVDRRELADWREPGSVHLLTRVYPLGVVTWRPARPDATLLGYLQNEFPEVLPAPGRQEHAEVLRADLNGDRTVVGEWTRLWAAGILREPRPGTDTPRDVDELAAMSGDLIPAKSLREWRDIGFVPGGNGVMWPLTVFPGRGEGHRPAAAGPVPRLPQPGTSRQPVPGTSDGDATDRRGAEGTRGLDGFRSAPQPAADVTRRQDSQALTTAVPAPRVMLLDRGQDLQWRAARAFRAAADEYLVFVHGTPDGPMVGGRLLTAVQLAELIHVDPTSHGRTIILVQCGAAATATVLDDFAAKLFSELPRENRRVFAFGGMAWVEPTPADSTGYTEVLSADLRLGADGRWRLATDGVREYVDTPEPYVFDDLRPAKVIQHGPLLSLARTGRGMPLTDDWGIPLSGVAAPSHRQLLELGISFANDALTDTVTRSWASFPYPDSNHRPSQESSQFIADDGSEADLTKVYEQITGQRHAAYLASRVLGERARHYDLPDLEAAAMRLKESYRRHLSPPHALTAEQFNHDAAEIRRNLVEEAWRAQAELRERADALRDDATRVWDLARAAAEDSTLHADAASARAEFQHIAEAASTALGKSAEFAITEIQKRDDLGPRRTKADNDFRDFVRRDMTGRLADAVALSLRQAVERIDHDKTVIPAQISKINAVDPGEHVWRRVSRDVARDVITRVRSLLPHGPVNNYRSGNRYQGALWESLNASVRNPKYLVDNPPVRGFFKYVVERAFLGKHFGLGLCDEHAALAFVLLWSDSRMRGVPITFVHHDKKHAYVAIGPLGHPNTLVIDAWTWRPSSTTVGRYFLSPHGAKPVFIGVPDGRDLLVELGPSLVRVDLLPATLPVIDEPAARPTDYRNHRDYWPTLHSYRDGPDEAGTANSDSETEGPAHGD
ncbi:hypothetical protein [Catellatospora coxensis]|uniref:WXG100-like domain-containing protein n=1 Tax=Catellatospora coxensis TaxID=310354 RepID=UPI0031E1DB10